jgi:hypothetical protein
MNCGNEKERLKLEKMLEDHNSYCCTQIAKMVRKSWVPRWVFNYMSMGFHFNGEFIQEGRAVYYVGAKQKCLILNVIG